MRAFQNEDFCSYLINIPQILSANSFAWKKTCLKWNGLILNVGGGGLDYAIK